MKTLAVRAPHSPFHRVRVALGTTRPDEIAVVSGESDTVSFWNVQTAQRGIVLEGATLPTSAVAVSPDGRLAASAGTAGVRLWDTLTGRVVRRIAPGVESVAFSPDGKMIAGGGTDGVVHLWNTDTGQEVRGLTGHKRGITCVAFRPDGKQLASGSRDGEARVWSVPDGALVRVILPSEAPDKDDLFGGPASSVEAVAFRPDGGALLVGYARNLVEKRDTLPATARLFDGAGKEIKVFASGTGGVRGVAFSTDGKTALTTSGDQIARAWDVETGTERSQVRIPGPAALASVSRDYAPPIATAPTDTQAAVGGANGNVYLWDFAGGSLRPLATTPESAHAGDVVGVAWAGSDGRRVVSAGGDDTQRVWNAQSGAAPGPFFTLLLLTGDDWLVYAPDGRFDGSRGAIERVHFARGLETFGLEQFYERFTRLASPAPRKVRRQIPLPLQILLPCKRRARLSRKGCRPSFVSPPRRLARPQMSVLRWWSRRPSKTGAG